MSQQVKNLRDLEKVKLLRESIKRRFLNEELLNSVLEHDQQVLKLLHDANIKGREKAEKPLVIEEMKIKSAELSDIANNRIYHEKEIEKLLYLLPNFVDLTVHVAKNENENKIISKYGVPVDLKKDELPDYEILEKIDGYDSVRGTKISGHRGYFLKTSMMELNMALIAYAMDFLIEKGYTMMETPLFMKKSIMAKTAELKDFEETLYKDANKNEDRDIIFIATSEQPISAMHMNENLNEKDLPIRYGGVSKCFRKEAGLHGKDTKGIFRVHQFDKIEQFIIADEEDSNKIHENMLKISEEFYQSLNIPYRVVEIVSGGLNLAAYKKYDLEGYFPSKGSSRIQGISIMQ